MVREIIAIQVGQCGNQIGNVFWETMCDEHQVSQLTGKFIKSTDPKLDALKREKLNVYFSQTAGKNVERYVPRSVLVDLEPGVLDALKARDIGKLFKPDNFIFGVSGAANNWAKAHYQDGPELIDEIMDVIRREMEASDCPQGLTLTQSAGGGTGSGLGSLILLKLREYYPDRIIASSTVFPSAKVSDVVVEPYNAILTIPLLLEDVDQSNVIDNEALFKISQKILKQTSPTYSDLNWVISLVMSGVTSSLRFPGRLNGDLRKMGVNLVPFPRLHFFTVAAAPLFSQASSNDQTHLNLTVSEVLDQLWSGKHFLSQVNIADGKYLSTSCVIRGADVKTWDVENEQSKIQDKLMEDFVNWIPNNIMTSVVNVSPKYSKLSGSFIGNFTGINKLFDRISRQFKKMFKKKAFVHWYTGVGMDIDEIKESHKNVRDLIQEYQEKCDCVVDPDNPYERADDSGDDLIGDDSDDDNKSDDTDIINDDDDSDYFIDDGSDN